MIPVLWSAAWAFYFEKAIECDDTGDKSYSMSLVNIEWILNSVTHVF